MDKLTSNQLALGRGSLVYHDIFTPPSIARRIADQHLRPLYQTHKLKYPDPSTRPLFRLLEPAVGSGNLLWPAIDVAKEEGIELDIVVLDLQLDYLQHVQHKLATDYNQPTQLIQPTQHSPTQHPPMPQQSIHYLAAEAAAFAERGLEWPPTT